MNQAWNVREGRLAGVSLDAKHSFEGHMSVFVHGTGRLGPLPSVVEQIVEDLPRTQTGTAYEFALAMQTKGLTRPLLPELKLIYDDGSYEFFLASPLAYAATSSRRWRRITVAGTASKPLRAIEVFALDTGTDKPVSGSEWLDNARLVLAH